MYCKSYLLKNSILFIYFHIEKKLQTACTLEVYDDRNNQWTRLSDMNINKINYSVAYVNENVLIIGGTSSVQLCNTASQNYQLNSVNRIIT